MIQRAVTEGGASLVWSVGCATWDEGIKDEDVFPGLAWEPMLNYYIAVFV